MGNGYYSLAGQRILTGRLLHRLEGGQYQDRTIYEANRITYTPCEIPQPAPVTDPKPART